MRMRIVAATAVMIAAVASVSFAAGLTERLQTDRMTVLKVDRTAGRFQCAEHRQWMAVSKDSLASADTGDIVRLERAGGTARLVVVRTAADELTSPE